jgi:hypothetical protein
LNDTLAVLSCPRVIAAGLTATLSWWLTGGATLTFHVRVTGSLEGSLDLRLRVTT